VSLFGVDFVVGSSRNNSQICWTIIGFATIDVMHLVTRENFTTQFFFGNGAMSGFPAGTRIVLAVAG